MPTQAFSKLVTPTELQTLFGFPAYAFTKADFETQANPPTFRARLAIGPTLGEAWSVESLLLTVFLRYFESAVTRAAGAFAELTKQIEQVEAESVSLQKAAEKTIGGSIERENAEAAQHRNLAELAALKAARELFNVNSTAELVKESPLSVSVRLLRGTDVMAVLTPPKIRIGEPSKYTVEAAQTEVDQRFAEIIDARLPFDVPIYLGPGQQLTLELIVRGPGAVSGVLGSKEIGITLAHFLETENQIAVPFAGIYYERVQEPAPPLLRAA